MELLRRALEEVELRRALEEVELRRVLEEVELRRALGQATSEHRGHWHQFLMAGRRAWASSRQSKLPQSGRQGTATKWPHESNSVVPCHRPCRLYSRTTARSPPRGLESGGPGHQPSWKVLGPVAKDHRSFFCRTV